MITFKFIFEKLNNLTHFSLIKLCNNKTIIQQKYLKNILRKNDPKMQKIISYNQCQIKNTYSGNLLLRRIYILNTNEKLTFCTNSPSAFPTLMDFPKIVWPSFFKVIRNWITVALIIRPYFDKEFTLLDFANGSKKAVQIVSTQLSLGEFENLSGLVDANALNTLKNSVSKLSVAQRHLLQIDEEDIYFNFPYEIGIIFDENTNIQRRFVEITMVYFVLHGLKYMRERNEEIPMNIGTMPEYRDKIFILNYRFIREYTKGVEDEWTVNVVNHFRGES